MVTGTAGTGLNSAVIVSFSTLLNFCSSDTSLGTLTASSEGTAGMILNLAVSIDQEGCSDTSMNVLSNRRFSGVLVSTPIGISVDDDEPVDGDVAVDEVAAVAGVNVVEGLLTAVSSVTETGSL